MLLKFDKKVIVTCSEVMRHYSNNLYKHIFHSSTMEYLMYLLFSVNCVPIFA